MQGDTEQHGAGDRSAEDRGAAYLGHLEQRRRSVDQAMWQAPALTIAAQAFLLRVLTDPGVHLATRILVTIAALAATLAASLTLLQLRSREVLYTEAIARKLAEREVDDPRPAGETTSPVYLSWAAALVLLAIADVVALVLT